MDELTLAYYEKNTESYAASALKADLRLPQEHFTAYLPARAAILDLGCGPGRDTLAFLQQGYQVTAVDGTPAMCRMAAELTGLPVRCLTFEQLDYSACFDGVWACASLLHLRKKDLPEVLKKIAAALQPGGVFYISVKEGKGESSQSGRFYAYYSAEEMEAVLYSAGYEKLELMVTPDPRGFNWLDFIVKKK